MRETGRDTERERDERERERERERGERERENRERGENRGFRLGIDIEPSFGSTKTTCAYPIEVEC